MIPTLRATLVIVPLLCLTDLMGQGETCATATPVTGGSYQAWPHAGNGYEANACYTYPATNASWYSYTAPFTGRITIGSCDSPSAIDINTRLSILTGTCGALQCLYSSDQYCWGGLYEPDGASFVDMPVIAGITYYIQWDDFWDETYFQWTLTECAGTGSGTTYIDADNNGQHDGGEAAIPMLLEADPGNVQFWSDGAYTHCSAPGTYTITVPNPPPHHVLNPVSQSYSITVPNEQVTGLDFGFWPIPGIHDGQANVGYNHAWIGHVEPIHFQVRNIGTEPMTPTITITLDPLQTYVGSAQNPPTSVAGQTLTWAWPAMAPGEQRLVGFSQFTSLSAVPYEPVVTQLDLSIAEADVDLGNNHSVLTVPAKLGCDPNDKQVNLTTITPDDVADQKFLEYTVRFQNTGNAPAVNVVVVDSLDADLDLATFEMLGATHDYVLNIADGVATWAFPNIMLPDSASDLEGSQGLFFYRVAPKTSLVLGDQITNRADIYFDFNDAVLTNTTTTVVAVDAGVEAASAGGGLRLDPTISAGDIVLRWMRSDLAHARLTVTDAVGHTVHTAAIGSVMNNTGIPLDLGHLLPGAYVASLLADGVAAHVRFVIQR